MIALVLQSRQSRAIIPPLAGVRWQQCAQAVRPPRVLGVASAPLWTGRAAVKTTRRGDMAEPNASGVPPTTRMPTISLRTSLLICLFF
jgi:hypothetical protein